ncbi:hypothetical protein H072_2334 [Dactylellina haptotyla CBS 200.50]|uniref:TauD/TfdA-like domain-containing protein n=1 Tax=Dactylellina haptotyla (strain CBS 200.50) TaxID=1284197 RepID=S8C7F2_DACHA|nr:hypothetical protein H072_2334 [Dactylellina haptotyla CBS 200.50]
MASIDLVSSSVNGSAESKKPTPNIAAAIPRIPIPGPKVYNHQLETQGNDKWPPATYQNYLPAWPNDKYPPIEAYTHIDPGTRADPQLPDLHPPGSKHTPINPTIGTKITGVQLSSLSDAGKDQLALLAAQRKVLVFRDQDFADLPVEKALEFGSYFGRLHVHHSSATAGEHHQIHIVHRGAGDETWSRFFKGRSSHVSFHTDVITEAQPAGTTFMYILDLPEAGGDTIFADQVQAYKRLSPGFQERLHGLRAQYSGPDGGRGGICRRESVTVEHPIVRTHPVTNEKALFFTKGSCQGIVGYKKEESDMILGFLASHTSGGQDFQVRVKWKKGTVVVWDNRVTAHSSILDWETGERRHLARITPQAEKPFETPFAGT